MTSKALVSVLMTAYNRQKYIGEAIESVLASSYENFELIIVDDCSIDLTAQIANSYEKKDARIKVYINEKNLGDYPNRNRAISYSKGKYIMFVDSDDKLINNGMEKCVDLMENFSDCGLGMVHHNTKDEEVIVLKNNESIESHFFKDAFLQIGPGGTISRRSFLKKMNGYPQKYGPANDMYFNLKAACNTSILLIPFDFVYYRRHEGQEINNQFSYLYNNYRYLDDALKELGMPLTKSQKQWISKKNKRRFTVNIIKYFLKTGNISKTSFAIKEAGFTFKDALIGIFHFD